MKSINPATEEVIQEYRAHEPADIERCFQQAVSAFASWRGLPFTKRSRLMHEAARILRERKAEFATLMTREMGKTIVSAEAEVRQMRYRLRLLCRQRRAHVARRAAPTDATRSFVRFDPLGPVLAIMPWNFPFWQVFRFAAPSLMAGNVGILKHASNVPGCALAIEDVFRAAGFPPGLFTTLLISGEQAESLIANPAIRAVTLTGSESTGRRVAAAAGQALKKSVLELGGSDPFVILPDADIESTAAAAAAARCINSGQSCIAAKRFIVHESIASAFEQAMAAKMSGIRMGDPMDRGVEIGPLARADLRDALHEQVQRTVAAGARLLTGGTIPPGRGYYYPPTVLADVQSGMAAFDEETFGPVAAITRFTSIDEAIALANRSPYGLGASLWTRDTALAERLAARVESGCVFINGAVKSDPRLPFGGVKNSGYGRELAEFGIREFVNIKTVWLKETQSPAAPPTSE